MTYLSIFLFERLCYELSLFIITRCQNIYHCVILCALKLRIIQKKKKKKKKKKNKFKIVSYKCSSVPITNFKTWSLEMLYWLIFFSVAFLQKIYMFCILLMLYMVSRVWNTFGIIDTVFQQYWQNFADHTCWAYMLSTYVLRANVFRKHAFGKNLFFFFFFLK